MLFRLSEFATGSSLDLIAPCRPDVTLWGNRAYDSYYLPSLSLRRHLLESYLSLFRHPHAPAPLSSSSSSSSLSPQGIDLLLHPSAIGPAPLLSSLSSTTTTSPSTTSNSYVQDLLTVPASLTGLPAMSLPVSPLSSERGPPVGVGIVGFWGGEQMMMEVGRAVERALAAAAAEEGAAGR